MAEYLYHTKIIQKILRERRKRRAGFIISKVKTFSCMSIIDIGCGINGRSFEDHVDKDFKITGIDTIEENKIEFSHCNFNYYRQDAQDLNNFTDKEFDLAVSVGMMEHICDQSILQKMANEIVRISTQWVIVVPWKYALLEPHFKFPFFQLLPYAIKVFLTRVLNLHNLGSTVNRDYQYINKHYQWLPSKEWKRIFHATKVYVTPTMDTIAIVRSG